MRGSPFWQVLAVVVAFLAMGLPVWRLTRPAEAAVPKEAVERKAAAAASLTMDAAVDFVPAPTEFSLSYLGAPVLQGKAVAKAASGAKTPVPANGADLVLHVAWAVGAGETSGMVGPAAARVVIHLSDGRQVEKSFWSEDGSPLDTVLSVPGKTAADPAP